MTRFDAPGAAVRGYRPEPQSTHSARRFPRAVLLVPALALIAAVWLLLPRAAELVSREIIKEKNK